MPCKIFDYIVYIACWILRSRKTRPVVVLTGARQTGKTSTFLRLFPKHVFVSLDLPLEAEQAEKEPSTILLLSLFTRSNMRPACFGTSRWSRCPPYTQRSTPAHWFAEVHPHENRFLAHLSFPATLVQQEICHESRRSFRHVQVQQQWSRIRTGDHRRSRP